MVRKMAEVLLNGLSWADRYELAAHLMFLYYLGVSRLLKM